MLDICFLWYPWSSWPADTSCTSIVLASQSRVFPPKYKCRLLIWLCWICCFCRNFEWRLKEKPFKIIRTRSTAFLGTLWVLSAEESCWLFSFGVEWVTAILPFPHSPFYIHNPQKLISRLKMGVSSQKEIKKRATIWLDTSWSVLYPNLVYIFNASFVGQTFWPKLIICSFFQCVKFM